MLLGAEYYTVTRPGAVTFVGGLRQVAAGSTFSIYASVQPLTGRQLQMLPEAFRTAARYKLYTESQLQVAAEGRLADRVSVDGESFEVHELGVWTNHTTGVPHYRYVLVAGVDGGL
jgi:hypothetical protein